MVTEPNEEGWGQGCPLSEEVSGAGRVEYDGRHQKTRQERGAWLRQGSETQWRGNGSLPLAFLACAPAAAGTKCKK